MSARKGGSSCSLRWSRGEEWRPILRLHIRELKGRVELLDGVGRRLVLERALARDPGL